MRLIIENWNKFLKENKTPADGESDWYDDERGYETRADMEYATRNDTGLGDLQSDEQFTGGTPEEQMLTRIKARDLLAAMSKEELKELSLSLDAETVAELRHLLTNPMYQPGLEENITPGVQQLMKHYPHAAAKIEGLAGNGYSASEIKRMLNLGYRG